MVFRVFTLLTFILSLFQAPMSYALDLPKPGTMVELSTATTPVLLKGLKVHQDNPLKFDFIIDTGSVETPLMASDSTLRNEIDKLIKYFLSALTVPEKDLWVNLSPFEKDRMLAPNLGQTQMGQDMLAQDYILKQLTASMLYPEHGLGKAFWDKIYQITNINVPINTFNKVWIVADVADVYEGNGSVYVTKAHLKVLLETDYLAQQKAQVSKSILRSQTQKQFGEVGLPQNETAKNIMRETILPAIEREINEGKNFEQLRQMYYSMILASWYKMRLKNAILNQAYGNQSKVGVTVNALNPQDNEAIFQQYLQAYKKGVFNFVKETPTASGSSPRKYFSGGLSMRPDLAMKSVSVFDPKFINGGTVQATVNLNAQSKKNNRQLYLGKRIVLFTQNNTSDEQIKMVEDYLKRQGASVKTLAVARRIKGPVNPWGEAKVDGLVGLSVSLESLSLMQQRLPMAENARSMHLYSTTYKAERWFNDFVIQFRNIMNPQEPRKRVLFVTDSVRNTTRNKIIDRLKKRYEVEAIDLDQAKQIISDKKASYDLIVLAAAETTSTVEAINVLVKETKQAHIRFDLKDRQSGEFKIIDAIHGEMMRKFNLDDQAMTTTQDSQSPVYKVLLVLNRMGDIPTPSIVEKITKAGYVVVQTKDPVAALQMAREDKEIVAVLGYRFTYEQSTFENIAKPTNTKPIYLIPKSDPTVIINQIHARLGITPVIKKEKAINKPAVAPEVAAVVDAVNQGNDLSPFNWKRKGVNKDSVDKGVYVGQADDVQFGSMNLFMQHLKPKPKDEAMIARVATRNILVIDNAKLSHALRSDGHDAGWVLSAVDHVFQNHLELALKNRLMQDDRGIGVELIVASDAIKDQLEKLLPDAFKHIPRKYIPAKASINDARVLIAKMFGNKKQQGYVGSTHTVFSWKRTPLSPVWKVLTRDDKAMSATGKMYEGKRIYLVVRQVPDDMQRAKIARTYLENMGAVVKEHHSLDGGKVGGIEAPDLIIGFGVKQVFVESMARSFMGMNVKAIVWDNSVRSINKEAHRERLFEAFILSVRKAFYPEKDRILFITDSSKSNQKRVDVIQHLDIRHKIDFAFDLDQAIKRVETNPYALVVMVTSQKGAFPSDKKAKLEANLSYKISEYNLRDVHLGGHEIGYNIEHDLVERLGLNRGFDAAMMASTPQDKPADIQAADTQDKLAKSVMLVRIGVTQNVADELKNKKYPVIEVKSTEYVREGMSFVNDVMSMLYSKIDEVRTLVLDVQMGDVQTSVSTQRAQEIMHAILNRIRGGAGSFDNLRVLVRGVNVDNYQVTASRLGVLKFEIVAPGNFMNDFKNIWNFERKPDLKIGKDALKGMKTVLIVGGTTKKVKALKEMLLLEGYKVEQAFTQDDAKNMIRKVSGIFAAVQFSTKGREPKWNVLGFDFKRMGIKFISAETPEMMKDKINSVHGESLKDEAMSTKGGIDLDAGKLQMNVAKDGRGVLVDVDPALVARFRGEDFVGVVFNIEKITPVVDVKAMLQSL